MIRCELGAVCGSTAMVVTMHDAATAALAAGGMKEALAEIAAGEHLSTLAFSEFGSRSHFWAPLGTATAAGPDVRLDAQELGHLSGGSRQLRLVEPTAGGGWADDAVAGAGRQ
jgi:isovaleryl-CoA dehydrogenase